MVSAFLKSTLRTFRENLGRFLANTLIIFVSLVLIAGLGAIAPVALASFSSELTQEKAADLIVKNTSTSGFSQEQIDQILDLGDFSYSEAFFSADMDIGGKMTRLYGMQLEDRQANYLTLDEGSYPTKLLEVAVGRGNTYRTTYHPGDTIDINIYGIIIHLRVTGVIDNPLYFTTDGEPALTDTDRNIEQIIYLSPRLMQLLPLPQTDLMLRFEEDAPAYFTDEYYAYARERADQIDALMGEGATVTLTMEENFSYRTLKEAMDKVQVLALSFPFFFVAICALVNFIIVRRLIEDERQRIGCCGSLGVPEHQIMAKYVSFAGISSLIGVALGLFVGPFLLPYVAYIAIGTLFWLPPIDFAFAANFGIYFGIAILVIALLETAIMIHRRVRQKPAVLMQPKAPKAGKKILLEHIKPLWRLLPFRYKSTLRNIFRNRVNLILTTLSVAGSTGLTFIGFALMAVSLGLADDPLYHALSGPMTPISVVVVICALAMAVLIVFNLADMNITERVREIATLKVLGYNDHECDFYVFREIIIMTIFGVTIGLPLGLAFMYYVLTALDFGSLGDISWYWYILTVAIILLSTLLVDGLLTRKIRAVDMNDSLKSLD